MGNYDKVSPGPGIYPSCSFPDYAEPSERRVYDALAAALPAGWFAWHSLRIRIRPGEFTEGDFIVADPARGLLVLEVKGGQVSKREGIWMQYGRPMDVPPLHQALRFRKLLFFTCQEAGVVLPPIGIAAVFPDVEFEGQPAQSDLEGLVIGARELPYLDELLPGFFDCGLPEKEEQPSPGWIERLHSMWCENWPEALRLSCLVEGRAKQRVRLDREQFAILEGALDNDLMVVRGGAGTGKTVMAWELARREAGRGKSVLLLTLTEALGLELGRRGKPDGVTASSLSRFALEKLRTQGFNEEERYEPEFWERVVRLAAEKGSLWKECSFDTVIVDEGQDLGKNEWAIVLRCAGAGERRRIWVFADEDQAFWEDREITPRIDKHAARFTLRRPYRCPPGIQALADAYAAGKRAKGEKTLDAGGAAIQKELADGTIKVIVVRGSGTETDRQRRDILAQAIGDETDSLLEEGFALADIAVISLRGMMYEENIMHCEGIGGHKLLKATDRGACCGLICDTFLRYKGLERPVVIVSDIKTAADNYNVRMNIAVSRAFGALRVVVTRSELEKDPILTSVSAIGDKT